MRGEQFYRGLMRMINESFSGMEFFALATDIEEGLTRFYENKIHQNISTDTSNLTIVALKDGKFAVVESNDFSKGSLDRLSENAKEILENAAKAPFNVKLPPLRLEYPHDEIDSSMKSVGPKDRAEIFDSIVEKASKNSLKAYGSISTEVGEMVVMSSNGLFLYQSMSVANYNVVFLNEHGSGSRTSDFSKSVSGLNMNKIDEVVELSKMNVPSAEIDPGRYTVILGPEAVATLFQYFAWSALNGYHYELGTSSAVKYLGKKIGPEFLNFKDDPNDERQIPLHFDVAGIKRDTFYFIEGGVLKNLMYSFGSALMFSKDPTGHSASLSSLEAVHPFNPVIEGGDVSKDDLFSSVEKGLYIHRFHYVNVVDPSELILTGMTRDGFFLVEGGRITKALKNMRFNVSFYEVLENLKALSRETEKVEGGYTGFVAPYALVENFNFTSKTDH